MTERFEVEVVDGEQLATGTEHAAQAAAFRWLADRHLDSSYRLARAIMRDPVEAEDATHDAFIQAWRHWRELRDPDRFEQWFSRILVNTCRDRLRRASRFRVQDVSAELLVGKDELAAADEHEVLRAALSQLSPDHRLVVTLRFYRDLTVDDIARQLGIRPGTVHSRLHYAMKQLHAALSHQADGSSR